LWLCLCYISSIFLNMDFGTNLYLSNQVLIKFDQLKLLIAVSQSAFPTFWSSCHIIPNTCWVPTISVLTLVIIATQKKKLMWSLLKMVLSSRPTRPRSIACEVWSLHFQDKLYNSDNLYSLLTLFSWYYSLMKSLYVWNLILAYI
jgi:hypothetical protein